MAAAGENTNPVGASLLAMVVNDNARRVPRGALGFIASKLAPTSSPHMGYYTHLTGPFSPNLRLAWHTVKQLVH
jgi:hypothetical protein